jgi:hypothetical protein
MLEGALNYKRFSLAPIHVSKRPDVFVRATRARFRNKSF